MQLTNLDRCQGILKPFVNQSICCSSDTLDKIEAVAVQIGTAVNSSVAEVSQALASLDFESQIDDATRQMINSVPELKELFDKVINFPKATLLHNHAYLYL